MSLSKTYRTAVLTGAVGLLALSAAPALAAPADGRTIYGVTSNGNRLVSFPSNNPGAAAPVTSTGSITGLGAGETVVGVDFRPANNLLYALTIGQTSGGGNALTGTGRIYTVDKTTAVATLVSTVSQPLVGAYYDIGFNPVSNALRIVSSAGQDLRVTNTGGDLATTVVDGTLAYAAGDANNGKSPRVAAIDYTANTNGATTLFDIDYAQDSLAIQDPPNNGTLNTVGKLGTDVTNLLGFDIETDGTAYATAQVVEPDTGGVSGGSKLFTIDKTTGTATVVGSVSGDLLDSITVDTTPNATPPPALPEFPAAALAPLAALGVGGVLLRQRSRRTA